MSSFVMAVANFKKSPQLASESEEKKKCPDCLECQVCSKRRCQLCRKGEHCAGSPELGPCVTHGEYLEWKGRKETQMIPAIDMSECTKCGSCLEVCPAVFQRNREIDYIELIDHLEYPEEDVQQAMAICPADCITWEKSSA
jgi:ferredoxin